MIELPLRIECDKPCREAAAWFIPGEEVATWLEEIARWDVAHDALRLLIVPTSRQNLHPAGVLVIARESGVKPLAPVQRWLPYGRMAGRLYLPVEARLQPDVSDEELSTLLASDREYVFHPGAGLCGFGPEDVRTVADLLIPPTKRERAWDGARPGVAFARRLVSLEPEETPSVEMVLQQGRDDIGTQGSQRANLPRSPEEPSTGMAAQAGRHAMNVFAGLIAWLTRLVPATSAKPTWINKLQNWASRKLDQVHEAWNKERMSEILRLLEQLKNDPDRGLKYALPVGGDGQPRGYVQGGDKLTLRDVNFNLGQLGGGGPASYWYLPDEFHRRLVAQYRETANRELQLGRHRRAAYIFAQLLGDLESAASALTQGCHWREAAILYRDKLKRPLEAANCLERGGLWTEAIALYAELNEFEKAGDLCRKLEQEDAAVSFFERAVERHRASNILSAARILEEKLSRPDNALVLLDEAWPFSGQAGECLRESFHLRGSLGRHEDTQLRLRHLREEPLGPRYLLPLVEALSEVATRYPDRAVCHVIADITRIKAAEGLSGARTADTPRFLTAVERLAPEDRLLPRDCRRFLERPQPTPPPLPRPVRGGIRTIRRVHHMRLEPLSYTPLTAVHLNDTIYVAGQQGGRLILARCNASGHSDYSLAWPINNTIDLLMATASEGDRYLVLHVLGETPLPKKPVFAASNHFPDLLYAGGLAGMSPHVLGLSRPAPGSTWILVKDGTYLTLMNLGADGQTYETRTLGATVGLPPGPIPLHAWNHCVCLGLHDNLLLVWPDRYVERIQVPHPIERMSGTSLSKRCRLLLGFAHGVLVFDERERTQYQLAVDAPNPVSAFIGDGMVAIASIAGIEVYIEKELSFLLKAQMQGSRSTPLAVLSMARAGEFAVVSSDGTVEWFAV